MRGRSFGAAAQSASTGGQWQDLSRRCLLYTSTERYVREWLSSQAAGGYVTYDKSSGRFSLTEEQAFVLADDNSPAFLPGAFQVALASTRSLDKIADAFKTGKGVGWHEHDPELFVGTERFFRPGYAANLTKSWIPALDAVESVSYTHLDVYKRQREGRGRVGLRHQDSRGAVAAAHVGNARAALQFRFDRVERRNPGLGEIRGIAGTKKPLRADE